MTMSIGTSLKILSRMKRLNDSRVMCRGQSSELQDHPNIGGDLKEKIAADREARTKRLESSLPGDGDPLSAMIKMGHRGIESLFGTGTVRDSIRPKFPQDPIRHTVYRHTLIRPCSCLANVRGRMVRFRQWES
jgi:hypothetical protein